MNVVDVSIESDNLDNVESKTVDSKKEKRYNRRRSQYSEFNTNAMIWANSANTQIGDTKILNNNGKFVLIEATENGYIEIESGNYDAVKGAKEYYETTNKAREIFDRYAESLEAERRRDDWSFSSTKNATYERRIAGLDSRKPDSNQSRIDEQSGTDNQKFSLKSNVEETKEHKQAQYELIQKTNPKDESINKYATWIDKPSDVRTFREALEEDGGYWDGVAPDFTADDIQKALKSGYVTVYSTYPIKNGVFVSPSRMEAESYGVRDKIHTKRVALTDVAWIDAGQGQYAKVDDAKFSTKDSEGKTLTPEQQEYFKGSKVIDTKGILLRVYHASVEDFNVFDKDKIRKVDYDAPFNGFWFSNNKNTSPAMRQGKYLKSGYLNVTNPAPLKVWRQVVKEVRNDDVSNPMSRSSNDEVRYRLQDMGYDGVHWDGVPDVDWDKFYADGYVEFNDVRGYKFALRLNEDYGDIDLIDLHYDYGEVVTGYEDRADFEKMQEEVWVAFESNQFKNADNTTPTDSEDVRYSDKNMDFGVTQPEINDFVENAFVNKPNNQSYLKFANVSEKLYNDIKSLFPDVNKYTHALRENDIRHIRNSHGKYTNEKYPVLETDVELIPYIVKNYDKVFYADHNGKRGIYYVKVMSNNVVYYLEQATNKYGNENLLINKQMIKSSLNEIPNLKALKTEILKKQTESQFLNELKELPQVYAQSVREIQSADSKLPHQDTNVNTEDKSSLKDDYVIDNNFAVMTKERILREIEDSSAGTNKAYARRYITTISPTDYLKQMLTM